MKKRHKEIIKLLKNKPFMTIEELCHELNVSPATVRRDLSLLENSDDQKHADPYLNEKIRIAKAAAELVKEGDTVFMDAGSTNQQIVYHLVDKSNITIITNSIEIAYRLHSLKNNKELSVIICGGALGEANPDSIVGPVAEKMISMFRANICFIGTSGIDIKQGITDAYLASARIKENMIEHSNKTFLVTDHSKFGIINTAFVCSIDKIGHIITDVSAPADDISYLRSKGISVTIV
jgi:DeoR/GlpR family transcriptional regulator of sugar metabolism